MVTEPLSLLSTALGVVGGAALHAADLLQVPEEVDSSVAAMRACEKNLGALIELSKEHRDLLVKRLSDDAAIQETIAKAWADLQKVKPVLERCGHSPLSDKTNLRRRLRWKFLDQKKYQLLALSVSRNDVTVRDDIKKLEQMVYFNPLEKLAETAREEDRRRRKEIDQIKARKEIVGFGSLDPAGSPDMAQGPGQSSIQARDLPSPAPSKSAIYSQRITPVSAASSSSAHTDESSPGVWSGDSKLSSSNQSTITISTDSTLTGSATLTRSLAGLMALSPEDVGPCTDSAATVSQAHFQYVKPIPLASSVEPVLARRATG
jgi:hypothetical protein